LAGSKSAKAELFCSSGRETVNGSPRITVLGIGNLLLQDEGAGIHLVQRLADKVDSANINLIDGGTSPDILSLVGNDVDKLIVVDAAVVGDKPGTIYRFDIADLDSGTPSPVSLHELGLVDSLKIMNLFGNRPKSVTVIGIEPKVIDYGLELSPELEEKMPQLMDLVLDEIKETNTSMEVKR
jgi:hydrogenase maturation protease